MADNNNNDSSLNFPFSSMTLPVGFYWTGAGWASVMDNTYFGSRWQFYQSPVTGAAGPAREIADILTSQGIPYQVSNQVPPNTVDRAAAFVAGITPTDAVTASNTGRINYYNGFPTEQYAGPGVETAGGLWIPDQKFSAPGGWPNNEPAPSWPSS